MNLSELDLLEEKLLEKYRAHPFLVESDRISSFELRKALVQRRFLSTAFTPVFDTALDGMVSKQAIKVTRELIREEYPERQPSHRELLVNDLQAIGISRVEVLSSKPSAATQKIIESTFCLLYMDTDIELHEIKALSVVRLWGEVLVAEEYGLLRPALLGLGLTQENSQFYWPHFEHDIKNVSFAEGRSQGSHSDWLTVTLRELLNSPKKIRYAAKIEQEIFNIKYDFWNQFMSAVEQLVPRELAFGSPRAL